MDEAAKDGGHALEEHVRECDECRITAVELGEIAAALRAVPVEADVAALSARTLEAVRPELQRLSVRAFWRRFVAGLLTAILPLPAVLAADAFILRQFYGLLSALLPGAVAAFVVGGMALWASLLLAVSFALIPLLVERQLGRPRPAIA